MAIAVWGSISQWFDPSCSMKRAEVEAGFSNLHGTEINVLICTEIFGDRDAIEVFADLTVMDGCDVEKKEKANEEQNHRGQTDHHQEQLPFPFVTPAKSDEREQSVGKKESRDETEQVGVVIHPR